MNYIVAAVTPVVWILKREVFGLYKSHVENFLNWNVRSPLFGLSVSPLQSLLKKLPDKNSRSVSISIYMHCRQYCRKSKSWKLRRPLLLIYPRRRTLSAAPWTYKRKGRYSHKYSRFNLNNMSRSCLVTFYFFKRFQSLDRMWTIFPLVSFLRMTLVEGVFALWFWLEFFGKHVRIRSSPLLGKIGMPCVPNQIN